jgi:hypothetical protein
MRYAYCALRRSVLERERQRAIRLPQLRGRVGRGPTPQHRLAARAPFPALPASEGRGSGKSLHEAHRFHT